MTVFLLVHLGAALPPWGHTITSGPRRHLRCALSPRARAAARGALHHHEAEPPPGILTVASKLHHRLGAALDRC